MLRTKDTFWSFCEVYLFILKSFEVLRDRFELTVLLLHCFGDIGWESEREI